MIMAIDGNNLARRMYYAGKGNDEDVRKYPCVSDFFAYLIRLNRDYSPAGVVTCWDSPPYFRNKMYPKYKANRPPPEADWTTQLYLIQEVVNLAGIASLEARSYEADDLLATIASDPDEHALIISSDKDMLTLVSDTTTVELLCWSRERGAHRRRFASAQDVKEYFGCFPEQIPTYKGLAGDTSDNIPHVSGIGRVKALDLLERFGTAQNILDNLSELKTKAGRPQVVANNIRLEWETLILAKTLATPITHATIRIPPMRPLSASAISDALNKIGA